MRLFYFVTLISFFISCSGKKTSPEKKEKAEVREIVIPGFQTIIDAANVEGSILIYDIADDSYYSNNFDWARKGKLPASTFKITNSIIGLESKVVENDSTLFKWDGKPKRLKNWEQDLIFKEAFHYSCVPCYQEVARKIGADRMKDYLDSLDYGNMKVDSTNIDVFWLEGESKISQFEQVDFLKRFYQSALPISKRTELIMKEMIVIEENETYKLSGKTGWSIRNGNNNGWFVGYVESLDKVHFFATNIEPKKQFSMNMFPMIRKDITYKALQEMKLIE